MTISVRVYTHAGLSTPPVVGSNGRLSTDSVSLLKNPYLGGEVIAPDTSTAATSSAATAPDGTRIAYVQVPPGSRAYYEVTPANHDLRTATSSSPIIEGNVVMEFGPGWRLSALEVS